MIKLKFGGPQDYVNVGGQGQHLKGESKDYPDEVAKELMADERFSEVKTASTKLGAEKKAK